MISGLPAGQAPLNDTSPFSLRSPTLSSPKITESADTPMPISAVSTPDVDTVVQISPQAQRLAQLDAASTALHNQKEWKQQKKPKTLLDYIQELEVRGRGPRAEAAERRRQQLGNWMPMIAVGDETGMSINVLAKNLAAAAISDAADSDDTALPFPLPTVYVTRGKQGEKLATTTLKKDTPADDKKSDYLLMLQRLLSVADPALQNASSRGQRQDIRIVPDHSGNPDLSRMPGAVSNEQIKDKSSA